MKFCKIENCGKETHAKSLCLRHYKREWKKVSEAYKKSSKEYCKNRIVDKEKKKESDRKSYQKHKAKRLAANNKYSRERYAKDINFRLRIILRARLRAALKYNCKIGSAVRDLGCSIEDFKLYIESKFQEGMTWDNYSYEVWHIDHIKPLASFDLTIREEFLKACHYSNLQPMWAKENLTKKDKIEENISGYYNNIYL